MIARLAKGGVGAGVPRGFQAAVKNRGTYGVPLRIFCRIFANRSCFEDCNI